MTDDNEFPPPRVTDAPAAIWLVYGEIEREASTALRAALAAQPADAQPTGQSPCARHCEAPAFEGEIRRLKRELQTQAERIRVLREVVESAAAADEFCFDAGCRERLAAMARAALKATK